MKCRLGSTERGIQGAGFHRAGRGEPDRAAGTVIRREDKMTVFPKHHLILSVSWWQRIYKNVAYLLSIPV